MSFDIGRNVKIDPSAKINVKHGHIGEGSGIGANVIIEGYEVHIGKEAWLDRGSYIGGGSCFDSCAYLRAGDFFHMGWHSQVNIARGVDIGDEVGVGIESKIFTHGAYLAVDRGFPVQWGKVKIGSNVWLPHAWVNPRVEIGDNTVVAAGSVVNKSLPSGCLAGGVPCKVLYFDMYPREIDSKEIERLLHECFEIVCSNLGYKEDCNIQYPNVSFENVVFNLKDRTIIGTSNKFSEAFRDQLRRNGIRFRYNVCKNIYVSWEESI